MEGNGDRFGRGRGGRGGRGGGRHNGGRVNGRGRGNPRNFYENNHRNQDENGFVKLSPPNTQRGTLSNFQLWRESLYLRAKECTKHLHRLILTDRYPSVYDVINRNFLIQVFGALSDEQRDEIIDLEIISAEQAAQIPILENNAISRRYLKKFDEVCWDIWKEFDDDQTKIFNLVYKSLGRASEELVKGQLNEILDQVRTESDIVTLWNVIINTHNNSENVNPIDLNIIRQNYYTVKMQVNESLENFHARFELLEHNMRRVDRHFNPNSDENFILFVEALDNKRYADFKVAFLNDIVKAPHLRSIVPQFRGAIFELVKNFNTVKKYEISYNNSDRNRSAYSIQQDSNNKSNGSQKNNQNNNKFHKNKRKNRESKPFVPWSG